MKRYLELEKQNRLEISYIVRKKYKNSELSESELKKDIIIFYEDDNISDLICNFFLNLEAIYEKSDLDEIGYYEEYEFIEAEVKTFYRDAVVLL